MQARVSSTLSGEVAPEGFFYVDDAITDLTVADVRIVVNDDDSAIYLFSTTIFRGGELQLCLTYADSSSLDHKAQLTVQ